MFNGDLSTKREETQEEFLKKKRNLDTIQHNYLFRRTLSQIPRNDYERIANLYYFLTFFSWKEDIYSKNSILQNLRGNSFWFYLCSSYFPFDSNELLDKYNLLPEGIRKYIIDRQAHNKRLINKTSLTSKKEQFIDDIESLPFYHAEAETNNLDDIITSMEKSINDISERNTISLNTHIKKETILVDKPEINYYDSDKGISIDVEYHSKSLNKFIEYIKYQNETRNLAIQEEIDPDDVACIICNDGDYENDNLIVYCSLCHITVHQKCYGITIVPKDDWICHSCLIFGQGSHMDCVLCPVKGGAMKTCGLKKTSSFYNFIMTLRKESSNDNFASLLIEGNKTEKDDNDIEIEEIHSPISKTNETSNKSIEKASGRKPKKNKKTKDESILVNAPNEYINKKIANEYGWIHMSCALWIPEVKINNYEEKEEIKGIEAIGKKRFNESCEICLLKGYGPTIKCERCDLRFHVECARKNNYQLESSDNQLGESKFVLFCQRHAPHKLVKYREIKKQRDLDEIIQLSKILEKNINDYNKSHKKHQLNVCMVPKGQKIADLTKKITLNQSEKKKFISAIRKLLIDISSLSIKVNKVIVSNAINTINTSPSETNEKAISFLYQMKKDDKIKYIYADMFIPSKFPWYMLKETELYLKESKPIEIFQLFKVTIPNEIEFNRLILRKNIKKIPQINNNDIPLINNNSKVFFTLNQQPSVQSLLNVITYCYCRINSDAPFMIGCENGDKCPNNGWYHQECVEELKNLSKEEIQSDSFTFTCPECRKLILNEACCLSDQNIVLQPIDNSIINTLQTSV